MQTGPSFLIIPAAGLGTRMRSIDPGLPKEMFPVGGKPAIQYVVEEGLDAGISNIVIIIRKGKEIIRKYFEDEAFRSASYPDQQKRMKEIMKQNAFTFLYQDEPTGESDAIALAKEVTGANSIAVMYPDNLYFPAPGALRMLKEVFQRHALDVSALMEVTEINAPGISNAGRVDIVPLEENVFRIDRILPKGEGYFISRFEGELRTCGIAITGPHLFDYIERARSTVTSGEFTDVPVRELMLAERTLLGCRLPGTVFDIGNPEGYRLCLRYVSN